MMIFVNFHEFQYIFLKYDSVNFYDFFFVSVNFVILMNLVNLVNFADLL